MFNKVRPAAVAGTFYPESPEVLARDVAHLLSDAVAVYHADASGKNPKALIVPHAGYIYSGPIAASGYTHLTKLRARITRVVLLGPTHRVAVHGLAIPTSEEFQTPLGGVRIDRTALDAIADWPQIVVSDEAHSEEDSLQVQLPFLQSLLDDFSLLPFAVGKAEPQAVAEVIEHFWGDEETLIVVSSDLSHYLPHDAAQQVDGQTAQRILELDTKLGDFQACGAAAINGFLLAAQHHDLRVQLLDLRNSGDIAGDQSRVVGYASFAFFEDNRHAH